MQNRVSDVVEFGHGSRATSGQKGIKGDRGLPGERGKSGDRGLPGERGMSVDLIVVRRLNHAYLLTAMVS